MPGEDQSGFSAVVEQAWIALRAQNWAVALDLASSALEHWPEDVDAMRAMAISLWGLGRVEDAAAILEKAAACDARDTNIWSDLGVLRINLSRPRAAADAFERSLKLDPVNLTALHGLGQALLRMRRYREAIPAFERCLQSTPGRIAIACALGVCLAEDGRLAEAEHVAEECVARDSQSEGALLLLAAIRQHQLRFEVALVLTKAAVRLNPASFTAQGRLAVALWNCGLLAAALAIRERALSFEPTERNLHSNLAWLALHDPAQSAQGNLEIHETTARRWRHPTRNPFFPNPAEPDRCLRVGYICPEFIRNPEICFLSSWMQHHSRAGFESIYYLFRPAEDEGARRFRLTADHVREAGSLDDSELASMIKQDEIDILVDLAGHLDGNRLNVFSRRPAPVQVAFPHYPSTTGVEEISYVFTDRWTTPALTDSEYTELPYRLPSGYLVYQPAATLPPVASLPFLKNEFVTFGLFQRPGKYHARTWDAVAAILSRLPESRLLIHFQSVDIESDSSAQRVQIREALGARGIAADRLSFAGSQALSDHLCLMSEVDVALDSFPYNGQTTTCDCLWMGVPVVALRGRTHVARVGQALLERIGLGDLAAGTLDDYIRTAVAIALDRDRLMELRATLRDRAVSALGDGRRLSREIEEGYRWMWRQWCGSRG